ncbi:hypothetical protein PR048_023515 [Dryococelus australis]|uniref:Integrase catalytic domain-containing protein n=1 Tax=Dryococelus australis TaxID=614101 RepID=A0ABQ9GUG4_9NEOP|nr:hypothetical protein PR048_023515 [Dryococelus australis]
MDIFTKYTKLYAVVNATAQVLLGKMKSFIEVVGKPEAVLSDKGIQFNSNVWQQGMLKLRIVPTTAYNKTPKSFGKDHLTVLAKQ